MSHNNFRFRARHLNQTVTLLLFPLAVFANTGDKPGYLLDQNGDFVHSGTPGQCWHTGEWTPALSQAACDPILSQPKTAIPVTDQQPTTVAATEPPAPQPTPETIPPTIIASEPKAIVETVPAPIPVPVTPPATMVSYNADTLFDFDKFSISSRGKKALNEVSDNILGLNGNKVDLVGHTDRIGRAAYNQILSLKRANTVRDYLITKGVPAEQIKTRGAGETEPVTKTGDCAKGPKAKVILCLQPDRRVDIVFSGTKISKD